MTSATRKALVDVYGTLIKAGWGEPTDQAEEPANAAELEPSRQAELDLKRVALAIKQLQRLGELESASRSASRLGRRALRDSESRAMKKKTKILIVAANPKDTSRLRLDEEVREIEAALQRSSHRAAFTVKSMPPQQNLWVRFGSGRFPRLWRRASFATLAVRKPYDFLVTSFTLLFSPSTAPAETIPRARNQLRISGR